MEIDYGAVFDVEVPETTTGAEETEIAAPSEETGTTTATAQGAEEQEAATHSLPQPAARRRRNGTPLLPRPKRTPRSRWTNFSKPRG